ncbi:class I SAM-dependent methyltransferase [bacterium AH-315-C07]|nr:class I SAM-dependent methyltransferase [bacterium AH-315-C07]
MDSKLSKKIISKRYTKDFPTIWPLSKEQQFFYEKFQNDPRIMFEEVSNCCLCNSNDYIVVAEKDRYGFEFRTTICNGCGLIFSYDRMTKDSTHVFYSEYFRPIFHGRTIQSEEVLERHYSTKKPEKVPKFLEGDKTVVELGAGGGWNLMPYKLYGLKHYGFDFDQPLIDYGREKQGLNMHYGGLDEAIGQGVKGDYIIISHVLEHLIDPVEFLIDLKKITNETSLIHITVPPLDYLLFTARTIGYDLLSTIQIAHNYLFSKRTLTMAAKKSGYKIICAFPGEIVLVPGNQSENYGQKIEPSNVGSRVCNFLKLCAALRPIKNSTIKNLNINNNNYHRVFYPFQFIKKTLLYKYDYRFNW